MNIIDTSAKHNKARELKKAGKYLEAARLYVSAQHDAAQCRSAKRYDLAFAAHVGAVLSADRVLKTSGNPADRSEAGRIKAESNYYFRRSI